MEEFYSDMSWQGATDWASDKAQGMWEFMTPSNEDYERKQEQVRGQLGLGENQTINDLPEEDLIDMYTMADQEGVDIDVLTHEADPDTQFGLTGQDYAEVMGVAGNAILQWTNQRNKNRQMATGRFGTNTTSTEQLGAMFSLLGIK